MDPWTYLPPDLRTSWGPQQRQLHWQADLGPGASPDRLANYLHDLQTLLDCGQRWGRVFAEAGAVRAFYIELRETGNVDLDDQERSFWTDFIDQFEDQRLSRESDEFPELTFAESALFGAAVTNLVGSSTQTLLGRPLVIRSLSYQNPIRIDLEGSGLGFRGVDALVGTISSWRRRNAERRRLEEAEQSARTRVFEAQARYLEDTSEQIRAETRIKMAQADLAEMYALGVKSGTYPIVPPGDLARLATTGDLEAIARLNNSNFSTSVN